MGATSHDNNNMATMKKDLVLEYGNNSFGAIQISETDTLQDVRDLIHQEWDADMIPSPDFCFVTTTSGSKIRVASKQEGNLLAWKYLPSSTDDATDSSATTTMLSLQARSSKSEEDFANKTQPEQLHQAAASALAGLGFQNPLARLVSDSTTSTPTASMPTYNKTPDGAVRYIINPQIHQPKLDPEPSSTTTGIVSSPTSVRQAKIFDAITSASSNRKREWSNQEDQIVIDTVMAASNKNGHAFTEWRDLAKLLPGRAGKQIRDRWVNHLNPQLNHTPFSREDDIKLWEGHLKLGKSWVQISYQCFNSTRSENHIKNRWYSAAFKKFIAQEYGQDVYSNSTTARSKGTGSNNGSSSSKKEVLESNIDDSQETTKKQYKSNSHHNKTLKRKIMMMCSDSKVSKKKKVGATLK